MSSYSIHVSKVFDTAGKVFYIDVTLKLWPSLGFKPGTSSLQAGVLVIKP